MLEWEYSFSSLFGILTDITTESFLHFERGLLLPSSSLYPNPHPAFRIVTPILYTSALLYNTFTDTIQIKLLLLNCYTHPTTMSFSLRAVLLCVTCALVMYSLKSRFNLAGGSIFYGNDCVFCAKNSWIRRPNSHLNPHVRGLFDWDGKYVARPNPNPSVS